MPKYEMPEMSEMLTSLFGGGDAKKTTKTASTKGVAKRKWEQIFLNQHLDKVIVKQERKIIINKKFEWTENSVRRANKAAICIFFSFHLCVCRLLNQLTAFFCFFISSFRISQQKRNGTALYTIVKRGRREKKITSLLYLPIKKDKETEKITNKFAK